MLKKEEETNDVEKKDSVKSSKEKQEVHEHGHSM